VTVFVVDDETAIADTLAAILRGAGFSARAFYDGQQALDAKETPDFVISDVVMPGLNGLELVTQMRKRFPACQLLLFSGQAVHGLRELESADTSVEILPKPVHPSVLIRRVSAARDLLRHPPSGK